ncbi:MULTISPECIES: ABC transporter substrate-binding protein [Bradyrhizobium]|uniref:ABC transporter substrate-binding protein n=1 Tax=Bradyrhizobium TaxID=374 RepID=UPI000675CD0D|nr:MULTISPECIES: ABC transporter substrate-binding protein [Bradyrhizobium]MDI2075051.1 ABC transporter substrate-binding protein [Bradyrhizobium sp. Mp27]
MRRREFITILGGATAIWPLSAGAQQPAKMSRIALVLSAGEVSTINGSDKMAFRPFFEELSRLGYVEGQNLRVERYSGEGRTERYPELARHVVDTHPDLILTVGGRLSLDFKMATATVPIVTMVIDPIAMGLTASLARPGGNITGVTISGGLEIIGKRMGLLVEAVPKLSTVGFLASRPFWEDARGAAARDAAKSAGIALSPAVLGTAFNAAEYERTFMSFKQDRTDALMVSEEPEHTTYRALIVELAAKSRTPTIYPLREFVEIGGLMAYSPDIADIFRRFPIIIDKILKGASPGDIPFYQPTKFELSINLKTAKALGLEMPAMLLARADEVIE